MNNRTKRIAAATALTLAGIIVGANGAEAAKYNADDVSWGQLDIIDLKPIRPGMGKYTIKYRDTERDGMCVRVALVNEDGTLYKVGPRSCGKWTTWRPTVGAEDWPAPILIRSNGDRSTPQ